MVHVSVFFDCRHIPIVKQCQALGIIQTTFLQREETGFFHQLSLFIIGLNQLVPLEFKKNIPTDERSTLSSEGLAQLTGLAHLWESTQVVAGVIPNDTTQQITHRDLLH